MRYLIAVQSSEVCEYYSNPPSGAPEETYIYFLEKENKQAAKWFAVAFKTQVKKKKKAVAFKIFIVPVNKLSV